jgi:hypothetical protein
VLHEVLKATVASGGGGGRAQRRTGEVQAGCLVSEEREGCVGQPGQERRKKTGWRPRGKIRFLIIQKYSNGFKWI